MKINIPLDFTLIAGSVLVTCASTLYLGLGTTLVLLGYFTLSTLFTLYVISSLIKEFFNGR